MRPVLMVLAGIVVAVLSGCAGSDEQESATPAEGVRELTTLEPLKQVFNAAVGRPRLLLILDPT